MKPEQVIALLFILAFVFCVAAIPGGIARDKGHSFWGFWFFGLFFLPFAISTALLMPTAPAHPAGTTPGQPAGSRSDPALGPVALALLLCAAVGLVGFAGFLAFGL